jgi:hypothetical protein
MNHTFTEITLEVGKTYCDKRGVEWRVISFLEDEGRWFIQDPEGRYVHVMRADDKRAGKFVKRKTFLKSLEAA